MFPVQKSILSCQALVVKLSDEYVFIEENSKVWLFKEGVNDTYIIFTKKQKFFFRIYRHSYRSLENIKSEIEYLSFLKQKGIHVSHALPTKKNLFIISFEAPEGERYGVLFNEAIGKSYGLDISQKKCHYLGTTLASIHQFGIDCQTKYNRPDLLLSNLLDEPIGAIFPYIERDLYLNIKEIATTKREEINNRDLIKSYIHGDLNTGNVFFTEKSSPYIFDFDSFGLGYVSYDISGFLWSLYYLYQPWNKQVKSDVLKQKVKPLFESFLHGYIKVMDLSDDEMKSIVSFLPVRDIWLLKVHVNQISNMGYSLFDKFYFYRFKYMINLFINEIYD